MSIKNDPPIILILGATAVGKSAVGMELAKILNTDIISCDSMQIYKNLNIGTAKPTLEEQKQVKHHLIDIVKFYDSYSVSDYQSDAEHVITYLHSNQKTPLIVGGTGLYANSLVYDYQFSESEVDLELRNKLQEELARFGTTFMHNKLVELDEISAKQIHPNNTKRVLRAIEICLSSKKKKSNNLIAGKTIKRPFTAFFIQDERETLYNRINNRIDKMIKNGLVNEVCDVLEDLKKKNIDYHALQSLQAIGYKEIIEYLENKTSFEGAIDKLKQNTRNYAKRQITWFNKFPNIQPITMNTMPDKIAKKIAMLCGIL